MTGSTNWLEGQGGVYVVGIGLHPYQFPSDTPYTHLVLTDTAPRPSFSPSPWSSTSRSTTARASRPPCQPGCTRCCAPTAATRPSRC
ncbi:MAG: hypothetical protein EOP19_20155 [Hyphomicrobiales bacterium]|nr:MAG: hypothetical protein EOP19_20155 [Hyphomicrobiales bacterium]